MKNKNAADKDAAGTGGAHEVCYREAVMEPKGGTPQAPHTRNKWKHRKRRFSRASAAKKSKINKLTFVHFGKFLAI